MANPVRTPDQELWRVQQKFNRGVLLSILGLWAFLASVPPIAGPLMDSIKYTLENGRLNQFVLTPNLGMGFLFLALGATGLGIGLEKTKNAFFEEGEVRARARTRTTP